jgi:ferric-dicitrate binding protein FerR (iron transport regulator)
MNRANIMTETASDLTQTALSWHIRLRDGSNADWDAFTDWLAEHPDHAEAYAEIEAMDHALDPALPDLHFPQPQPAAPLPIAANDDPLPDAPLAPGGGRRGVLAAGLALALFMGPKMGPGSSRYQIVTAPGESRMSSSMRTRRSRSTATRRWCSTTRMPASPGWTMARRCLPCSTMRSTPSRWS